MPRVVLTGPLDGPLAWCFQPHCSMLHQGVELLTFATLLCNVLMMQRNKNATNKQCMTGKKGRKRKQRALDRLAEQGLTDAITAAIVKVARDPQEYVRLAAGRAAGHALVAQGRGTLPPTVLTTLTPVLVALLGADQSSDVQRMGLLVIRRACGARAALFVPSYAALVPSLCALIKGSMGPIKLAAERALGTMLQVEQVWLTTFVDHDC